MSGQRTWRVRQLREHIALILRVPVLPFELVMALVARSRA